MYNLFNTLGPPNLTLFNLPCSFQPSDMDGRSWGAAPPVFWRLFFCFSMRHICTTTSSISYIVVFLFWVFQFLQFLSRFTAVKSKPGSPPPPNKHITVKTASALVTQVKICSQDKHFTSFQPSLVQSFLCYNQAVVH